MPKTPKTFKTYHSSFTREFMRTPEGWVARSREGRGEATPWRRLDATEAEIQGVYLGTAKLRLAWLL